MNRVAAALTMLCVGAGLFLGTSSRGAVTPPPYTLTDEDKDGLPDSAQVGDFDGDGVHRMDDIQDAMDALTDPGPKTILVEPGDYLGPTQPQLRPGRSHAILELRSNTTLVCSGVGSTILHAAPLSPFYDYAIVANDDHVNGNTAVEIRNCEIDGGAPATYNGADYQDAIHRGVFFRRTRDGLVTGSYIHNTVHAGLYTSNSRRDRFIDNVVDSAGGWGDERTSSRQPCIYVFAFGGSQTVDFVASGNRLSRCGFGLNTRAEHTDAPGDVIRNLLWEDNTLENMLIACLALRGVDGAIVRRNTCHAAGAVQLVRADYGTGYRWQGNDNANSNVWIEDVDVTDTQIGQAAFDIGAFVDGLTIRNVHVQGTRDAEGNPLLMDCMAIQRPLRRAVLDHVELRDCGREGIVVRTVGTPANDSAEKLAFRNVVVDQVDAATPTDMGREAGIHFVGPHARLELQNVELAGATGPELLFDGATSNVVIKNLGVESVDPGWLGAFSEGTAPACTSASLGKWITTTNASSGGDCDFTPGTGGPSQARCGCYEGGWSPIPWAASPGIEFASGVTHSSVKLDGVTVANARGVTGIRVGGELVSFKARSIAGIDDSPATDLPQRSAIDIESASGGTVGNVNCVGTEAGVPCVE